MNHNTPPPLHIHVACESLRSAEQLLAHVRRVEEDRMAPRRAAWAMRAGMAILRRVCGVPAVRYDPDDQLQLVRDATAHVRVARAALCSDVTLPDRIAAVDDVVRRIVADLDDTQ